MEPVATPTPQSAIDHLQHFDSRRLQSVQTAIADWSQACSSLNTWEQQHLRGRYAAEALPQHKQWLEKLLFWGRLYQAAVHHPDFPDKTIADTIDERVGHLEDKYAIWHAGMTSEDEPRILHDAYD